MRIVSYISIFLLSTGLLAQTLVIPADVSFQQTSGAKLSIEGDFIINGNYSLDDNDSISVSNGNLEINQPINFGSNGAISVEEGELLINRPLTFGDQSTIGVDGGDLLINQSLTQGNNSSVFVISGDIRNDSEFLLGQNSVLDITSGSFINNGDFTTDNNTGADLTSINIENDLINAQSFSLGDLTNISVSGKLINQNSFISGSQVSIEIGDSIVNESEFRLGDEGSLVASSHILNEGRLFLNPTTQTFVGGNFANDLIVEIADGSSVTFQNDVVNTETASINNSGTLSVAGNWVNTGVYNGFASDAIQLIGSTNQVFDNNEIRLGNLTIDNPGTVELTGNNILVSSNNGSAGSLNFANGVLTAAEGTVFTVGADVTISGGSVDSYFEGPLRVRGDASGNEVRSFPVGKNGGYGYFEMFDVTAPGEYLVSVELLDTLNEVQIGDSVAGVIPNYFWDFNILENELNSSKIMVDFYDLDFANFSPENPLRADNKKITILFSDSTGSLFRELPVSEEIDLENDVLSGGETFYSASLTTSEDFEFTQNNVRFGIGAAPQLVESETIFIPEAFSPAATDIRNRTYKVFANEILDQGFRLRIYNRFNQIVFETTDPEEGWNGKVDNVGEPQPAGVYFVVVNFQLSINSEPEQEEQAIYMAR